MLLGFDVCRRAPIATSVQDVLRRLVYLQDRGMVLETPVGVQVHKSAKHTRIDGVYGRYGF